jgi:hypothetical protein
MTHPLRASDPRVEFGKRHARRAACVAILFTVGSCGHINDATADEGGVGFWLPGLFGSFAATPTSPGWALSTFLYGANSDAGSSTTFLTGGSLVAGLHARAEIALFVPSYTFADPLLGGQAAISLVAGIGRMRASVDTTLSGPNDGRVTRSTSDTATGGTDLEALGTLKWQHGSHNFLAYTLVGMPTGAYQFGRLANLGLNHWSIDAGGGYTYFDPKMGHELSAVAGITYSFENPDSHYQNGVDGHLDWAASQFFNEQFHAGVVGYFYRQITGDHGTGAVLGDFKARTNGIGPEIGCFFPFAGGKGYVNLKGYWEFDANHRPEGWNAWLTLALPLGGTPR